MPTQRQERVNNLLQREISDIVRREMQDPHLAFLTVTGVTVSVDLRYADVFVSVLGTEEEARKTISTLRHAKWFIRNHLLDRLDMRRIPELRFKLDETAAHAEHMARLLRTATEPPTDDKELPGDPLE